MVIRLETFYKDELGFKKWLDEHPKGYCLNMSADKRYFYRLHRAECSSLHHLRGDYKGFTFLNIKVCSDDRHELEQWVREHFSREPILCGRCL